MLTPFLALLLPPLLLVPAMGLLSSIESCGKIQTEIRRKSFHISIGLASLAFPLILTEAWMVIFALALATAWMLSVRRVPAIRRHFGSVLHDAERTSYGELYFAASIAALMLASNGDIVLFVVPILVLTFADAFAAIVGQAFPVTPFGGAARGKTLAGSAAFFLTALIVTWPALVVWTDFSSLPAFAIALIVATTTCFAEAISSKGFDNLAVPTVALFILKLFLAGA